jgi:hypothetical protein
VTDGGDREPLSPHQRVEPGQGLRAVLVAPQIECGAHPGGHRQAGHAGDFVVTHGLESRDEPGLRAALHPGEFDRLRRIHPWRMVQRRCHDTRDHAASTRREPGGDRTVSQ